LREVDQVALVQEEGSAQSEIDQRYDGYKRDDGVRHGLTIEVTGATIVAK